MNKHKINKIRMVMIALLIMSFAVFLAYAQAPPGGPEGPGMPGIPPGGPGSGGLPVPDPSQQGPQSSETCGNGQCSSEENCALCPQDCGQCGQTSTPSQPPLCTELWTCTSWSVCINSYQTRACTDSNSCGTTASKPNEREACTPPANITSNPPPSTINPAANETMQNLAQNLSVAEAPKNDDEVDESAEAEEQPEEDGILKHNNLGGGAIYIAVLAVIISIAMMTTIFGMKGKKISEKKADESASTFGYKKEHFPKLVSYIKTNLSIGHDIETIKRKLIEAGHDARRIELVAEHILKRKI